MSPIETTQFALQFTAPWSPWWLLPAIPIVTVLGWLLYRTQTKDVSKENAGGLTFLRLVLLIGLVFLAFRPSFILSRILTYPGRIIFVVDNSESMAARDSSLTDVEALRIKRQMANRPSRQSDQYHRLASLLLQTETTLRKFERFQRNIERSEDRFWDEADKVQNQIDVHLAKFSELVLEAPPLADPLQQEFQQMPARIGQLRKVMSIFFSGQQRPSREDIEKCYQDIALLVQQLLNFQAAFDRKSIADGNDALKKTADEIRSKTRIELVTDKLKNFREHHANLAEGQFLRFSSLMHHNDQALDEIDLASLKTQPGNTPIVSFLIERLLEDSEFPLTAFILISDGRNLDGQSLIDLTHRLSLKQTPVFSAEVGCEREPFDLAVERVTAPPFAVKNSPVRVRPTIKSVLKAPTELSVQILDGKQVLATEEVEFGKFHKQRFEMTFTPAETGLFKYRAQVSSAPGETFPVRNNASDFAVHVRDDKVRVLFLDWKPRWETRFALNIFQRMNFIDLNAIIAIVEKEGTVKRGVRLGAWPENLDALEMYDLVVLGDLPPGLLSLSDWEDLTRLVTEKGKTICFLGNGHKDPLPNTGDLVEKLLPRTLRSKENAKRKKLSELAHLQLTQAGLLHPVTRSLAGGIDITPGVTSLMLRPDTQMLLASSETGEPVLTCRFAGQGKTMLLDTDQLWKILNPTMLSAHANIFVKIIQWAVEGGYGGNKGRSGEGIALALDQQSFINTDSLQVWVSGIQKSVTVVAESDGGIVAEANSETPRQGSSLHRAVFEELPAGNFVFRLKKDSSVRSQPVVIVKEYPELKRLARDDEFLSELAGSSGGESLGFAELEKSIHLLKPKERIEKKETTWRLWDSGTVLGFIVLLLTVEWVWRKLVGLV